MILSSVKKFIPLFFLCTGVISLLYLVPGIMSPFIIGISLAYIVSPIVNNLQKHTKISLPFICLIMVMIFILFLILLGFLILPKLYIELNNAYNILLKIDSGEISRFFTTYSEYLYPYLPSDLQSSVQGLVFYIPEYLIKLARGIMGYTFNSTSMLFNILISVIFSPLIGYYLIKDRKNIADFLKKFIPSEYLTTAQKCVLRIDTVFASFIKGQIMVALFWGIYYSLALHLIGLESALAIGISGGIMSFIPYVGAIVTFLISALVAALEFGAISYQVLFILIACVMGQILDALLISYRLVGRRLGLHPVVILFSLLLSSKIFGLLGMFIILPVTVLIKELIMISLSHFNE